MSTHTGRISALHACKFYGWPVNNVNQFMLDKNAFSNGSLLHELCLVRAGQVGIAGFDLNEIDILINNIACM